VAGVAADGGTRAVVTALAAKLGIAVSKFVAAGITGSSSMLAEGVHSVADSTNQALLLLGGRRAINAAEHRIRAAVPVARYVAIEPDLDRLPEQRTSSSP
jgi:Co/Zn/Cd efflux system component